MENSRILEFQNLLGTTLITKNSPEEPNIEDVIGGSRGLISWIYFQKMWVGAPNLTGNSASHN